MGILVGNGDGTFLAPVAYGSAGRTSVSVAIGDVNGDGRLDLMLANLCGKTSGNGAVGVLLNNYTGKKVITGKSSLKPPNALQTAIIRPEVEFSPAH